MPSFMYHFLCCGTIKFIIVQDEIYIKDVLGIHTRNTMDILLAGIYNSYYHRRSYGGHVFTSNSKLNTQNIKTDYKKLSYLDEIPQEAVEKVLGMSMKSRLDYRD
uniref:Uncharacterized protein n=1 Tax=Cacopsylla melanoneura TaxID=428564 RepID=A0A8D8Z593_9HEMI